MIKLGTLVLGLTVALAACGTVAEEEPACTGEKCDEQYDAIARSVEILDELRANIAECEETVRTDFSESGNGPGFLAGCLGLLVPEAAEKLDNLFDPSENTFAELVGDYDSFATCSLIGYVFFSGPIDAYEKVSPQCQATLEYRLIDAIYSMADFEGERAALPDSRDTFAACYEAYDNDGGDSYGSVEDLIHCAQDEVLSRAGVLHAAVDKSLPDQITLADVEDGLTITLIDQAAICQALDDLGPAAARDGFEDRLRCTLMSHAVTLKAVDVAIADQSE